VGLEALRLKLVNEPWAVTFESVSNRKATFGDKNAPPGDADSPRPVGDSPEIPYIERMLATKFGALRELKAASLKLLAMTLFAQAKELDDKERPVGRTPNLSGLYDGHPPKGATAARQAASGYALRALPRSE
jgi:hypothetical protein